MLARTTRVGLTLIAALITGLVALVALNTPVEAAPPPWVKGYDTSYDNYPPRESLFVRGTLLQDSKDGSYMNWYYYDFKSNQWRNRSNDEGPFDWPAADTLKAGSKVRVRINKPEKPSTFKITAYKAVNNTNDQHRPTWSTAEVLSRTLTSVENNRGDVIAWNATFYVNEPNRHYYISADGEWEGADAALYSFGKAQDLLHLKTR